MLLDTLVHAGIMTAERAAEVPGLFRKYDVDNSGTIDYKEVRMRVL